MYELNKRYGFYKFIILVPTTPIKEGTKSFIEVDYAKAHFADFYPDKRISLSILNAQKNKKGRKMFPQAISDFARGTILEKERLRLYLYFSSTPYTLIGARMEILTPKIEISLLLNIQNLVLV